jgi:hypothetical protein
MLAFHIGEKESEYVRVVIVRDNGDAWFSAQVEVAAGAFRGGYSAAFKSWAFSDFRDQLEQLYRTVSGSASFGSYEGQLEMTLACNAQGHIQLHGEARDVAGTGNRLIFKLELDQTYVPKIITDLRIALDRYPPRAP